MKKVLLFASAIALMTSCAETEFGTDGAPKLPEGISFQTSLGENPATRAQWTPTENQFEMFWYAEADRISIFSQQTTGTNGGNATDTWDKAKIATYKATKSLSNGVFTGVSDDNILDFVAPKNGKEVEASFIAVWPAIAAAEKVGDDLIAPLPAINEQVQANVDGSKGTFAKSVVDNVFMYSSTKATRTNSYDAVGEKLALNFTRPMTAMVFETKGYDNYSTDFGKLKSIKLEILGEKQDATPGYDATKKSNIDYGSAAGINLTSGKLVNAADGAEFDEVAAADKASAITLKFGDAAYASAAGVEWKDGKFAYMAMKSVARTKAEVYAIEYTFENIAFKKQFTTTSNWPTTAGNFVKPAVFDINAEKYFVTNGIGNTRALIINDGTLSEILGATPNTIKWAGKEIAFSEFSKIVSKVQLTMSELKLLKSFTNLKDVELAVNTAIPAETFTQTALTSVNMPLVNDIDVNGFETQTALANVSLPSYKFPNTVITNKLLSASVLTTLNMSSVERIGDIFPAAGITLQGFAKLKSVVVKPGLKIGTSSFAGCTVLASVDFPQGVTGASVELVGSSSFADCVALESISVSNTAIPVSTFEGCTVLESINGANGKGIVPTTIYLNAFKDCKALLNMDLSAATKIDASAFEGCTALEGVAQPNRDNIKVLYVNGITKLSDNVFKGCTSLKYISFANVTEVGDQFFAGCAVTEIEFLKAFISSKTFTTGSFGTVTNTKLFVTADQTDVSGNEITLNKVKTTFKTIVVSL